MEDISMALEGAMAAFGTVAFVVVVLLAVFGLLRGTARSSVETANASSTGRVGRVVAVVALLVILAVVFAALAAVGISVDALF